MSDQDRAHAIVEQFRADGHPYYDELLAPIEGALLVARLDERRVCTEAAGAVVEAQIRIDDEKYLAVIDRMIDLEQALRVLVAQLDCENELDDPRFKGIWPALSNARAVLLAGEVAS